MGNCCSSADKPRKQNPTEKKKKEEETSKKKDDPPTTKEGQTIDKEKDRSQPSQTSQGDVVEGSIILGSHTLPLAAAPSNQDGLQDPAPQALESSEYSFPQETSLPDNPEVGSPPVSQALPHPTPPPERDNSSDDRDPEPPLFYQANPSPQSPPKDGRSVEDSGPSIAVSASSPQPITAGTPDVSKEQAALAWGNPARAIPLYRSFNGRHTDHFYTTDHAEHCNAHTNLGYSDEGVAGYMFPSQEQRTVPLYRLWSGRANDHFYTTDAAERDNARDKLGYTYEGVAGFLYPDTESGALPLYRLWNPGWNDHFYTMSLAERENAAVNLGFTREGVAGYISPL